MFKQKKTDANISFGHPPSNSERNVQQYSPIEFRNKSRYQVNSNFLGHSMRPQVKGMAKLRNI